MPGMLDIALIAPFSARCPLVEYFVPWPRHVRAVDAGDPGARLRAYTRTLVEEWLLAAAVVAVMLGAGRSLGVLNLAAPHGWRLVFGAALPLAYLVLIVVQGGALARRTEYPRQVPKRREAR